MTDQLPGIRLNFSVPFPTAVVGGDLVKITKANGLWTIGIDFTQVQDADPDINQTANILTLFDTVGHVFSALSLADLVTVVAATTNSVSTARQVIAGAGLAGGGDLTADRTFSIAGIATGTLLANVAGGTAVPTAQTPSAVLDLIGATRGQILYRGASGWGALPPGTTGQVLATGGAGADPSWASVATIVNQSANVVYSGPASGTASTPGFRALVPADVGGAAPGGFLNKFRNGAMDVWQLGYGPLTVTTAGAYTADGWVVVPIGASVSVSRAAGRSLTINSLQITGATSVTDVQVRQRIESYMAAPLSGQTVTVQAQIYNNTGQVITPALTVKRPTAEDNYGATTTDVNAVSLQACAIAAWTLVSYTFVANAGTNLGTEITIDLGNNFSTSGKTVQITELDIHGTPGVATGLNSAPPTPEFRPLSAELPICRRYYTTSYGNGVAPGTATRNGLVNLGFQGLSPTQPTAGGTLFPAEMRATPSLLAWDGAGNASKASYYFNAAWTDNIALTTFPLTSSTMGFTSYAAASAAGTNILGHYAADARL